MSALKQKMFYHYIVFSWRKWNSLHDIRYAQQWNKHKCCFHALPEIAIYFAFFWCHWEITNHWNKPIFTKISQYTAWTNYLCKILFNLNLQTPANSTMQQCMQWNCSLHPIHFACIVRLANLRPQYPDYIAYKKKIYLKTSIKEVAWIFGPQKPLVRGL